MHAWLPSTRLHKSLSCCRLNTTHCPCTNAGVLDTSLSWVSSGAVGSAAFAAHDAGFDVWLANTRANPPRKNVRPDRQGSRYWHFTINDLALSDMAAQIEFIHVRKMEELKGAGQPLTLLRSGSVDTARGGQGMRHSTSSGAQEAGPSSIAITAGGSGRLDGVSDAEGGGFELAAPWLTPQA